MPRVAQREVRPAAANISGGCSISPIHRASPRSGTGPGIHAGLSGTTSDLIQPGSTGLPAVWLEPQMRAVWLKPNSEKSRKRDWMDHWHLQPAVNGGPSTAVRRSPVRTGLKSHSNIFTAVASRSYPICLLPNPTSSSVIHQGAAVRCGGAGQALNIVSALQQRYHVAVGVLVS